MAQNVKPLAQLDFSGGANLVVNPYLISQKQAADIQNLILDEHGSLRTRPGQVLLTTSTDTTNPIYYRGILSKVNGQEFPFAIQAGGTGSTIAFDTSANANFTSVTSVTKAITLGASATVVIVSLHETPVTFSTSRSVTFNNKPMTQIGAITSFGTSGVDACHTTLWGLLSPTTGSSKDVVVSFSAPTTGHLEIRSFTNTVGWGVASIANAEGSSSSIVMSSGTNHMVIDSFSMMSSNSVTGNQTSSYNTTTSNSKRVAGQRAAGAASVTMTWTGTLSHGGHIAVDLIPGGNILYNTTVEPWTTVGTLGFEFLPDTVQMSDQTVIINGYETPWHWDGTTLAQITADAGQTVPPGAKHGEFHLGALWLWNTNSTTTSLDGPSSLRASSTNNMNDWPNANQLFISKDDGQVGMGMSPFTIVETGIAPTSTLILFKNFSGYQVTGVFGASNFSVQPIKSDMGCIAPRTIQFVSGFGIIRLTHKGFALYNGVEDRLISEEMRPAIFGGHDFTGVDQTTIGRSWAAQSQNPPLYVAACPLAGAALTRLFIYDLIRRGWSICTVPVDITCLNIYFSRSQSPIIHAGSATGGKILRMFDVDTDDDGAAISWSLKTRAFFAGNQMTPSYWRRAQLSFNVEPNTTLSVTPIVDRAVREPQIFTVPDSSPPGDHTVDVVISPDIMETAHVVQLLVEGESHAHLRGLEFHVSPKPSTKYVSRA